MEKNQSQSENNAIEKQIHFYASDDQLAMRKLPNCRTLQQIFMEKITSDQHISQIYTCINEKIQNYRSNSEKTQEKIPEQIIHYLSIKAKLFYSFYSYEEKAEQVANRLRIFQIDNLYELFVDIHQIRGQVKDSIYKLHGPQKREIKVRGCLLLFKIEQLLKEIAKAAFPYRLYTRAQNTIYTNSQPIILSEFELILLEKQNKKVKKFQIQKVSPLKNSLLQLNDEIQTMKIMINKEQQALDKIDIRQSLLIRTQIDVVEKAIKISQLQYIKFTHETYEYLDSFLHKQAMNTLNSCNKFVESLPILQVDVHKIEEFANQRKQYPVEFGNYARFLKFIIENADKMYKDDNQKSKFAKFMQNLLDLLQRQIQFCKHSSQNMLMCQNYIAALRIQRQIDSTFLLKNQEHISVIFSKYLSNVINFYINKHWIVMNRIVSFEEDFTYCLLTTNKIVQTLIQYKDKFTQLIEKFTPQLKTFIEISKIILKNIDKKIFIQDILSKIYYLSLNEGYMKSMQVSKISEKSDVNFSIEVILSIEHDSIYQIKPYLRQIKQFLSLVDIIKRKDIKRNINKMQQEQFSKLKDIASYFSKERNSCVIYQLKSKILLFITLFKMGYHNPTIRQQQKLVNLRNRIINLYNRLYSNNSSSMMLSKINSISLRRSHSQESYMIYDPLSADLKVSVSDQVLKSRNQPQNIQIQASQMLVAKIGKFITINFVNKDNNSKLYLTNLLNILQHQLFALQKDINQENQSQLSIDYTNYLKVCMGLDQGQTNPNIQIILNIERLFYLGQYEKAWNILTKKRSHNAQFGIFIQTIQSSSQTSTQILKFLRLYNLFEKMNHMFINNMNKDHNIGQLIEMVNTNTLYIIPQEAIQTIYEIKARQNRLNQLEKFYQARLNDKQPANVQYKQIQSFLSRSTKGGIKVYKLQRINKTILKIQIGEQFSQHFQQISEQFKKYYLFNQLGIYKFNEMVIEKVMRIQIQSSTFVLKNNENVFKSKIIEFQENLQQKICRKLLQSIVQVLQVFYNQSSDSLQEQQITLTTQPLSFCINPFYGIIQKFIKKKSQKKKNSSYRLSIKNRQIMQRLIQPFFPHFSHCFRSHYFYFLESFTNLSKKPNISINKLLQLPLFMTLQEKEVFLVYFDNKMSDMCDSFHEQQRKLRKEKKYQQVQKLRVAKMKEGVYKNYSYHFIIGGVIQSEMAQLNISTRNENKRLDWISQHKNLMISYDLPKKEGSQQIKQYAYSLNYFLKYLRGALAHKMENNYKIILNISEEFPKIFDYLHRNKHILEAKFEDIIATKNGLLKEYFRLNQKEQKRLKLILQGNRQEKGFINHDVHQAISFLEHNSQKYESKMIKELTSKAYKCQKCNQLIALVKKSPTLFDLLQNIVANMAKKNQFLIWQHNFKDCYLSNYFKSHRILEIFGIKRAEPRHYLILSWWFYLETELPCLMTCLQKVRYILEQ